MNRFFVAVTLAVSVRTICANSSASPRDLDALLIRNSISLQTTQPLGSERASDTGRPPAVLVSRPDLRYLSPDDARLLGFGRPKIGLQDRANKLQIGNCQNDCSMFNKTKIFCCVSLAFRGCRLDNSFGHATDRTLQAPSRVHKRLSAGQRRLRSPIR